MKKGPKTVFLVLISAKTHNIKIHFSTVFFQAIFAYSEVCLMRNKNTESLCGRISKSGPDSEISFFPLTIRKKSFQADRRF